MKLKLSISLIFASLLPMAITPPLNFLSQFEFAIPVEIIVSTLPAGFLGLLFSLVLLYFKEFFQIRPLSSIKFTAVHFIAQFLITYFSISTLPIIGIENGLTLIICAFFLNGLIFVYLLKSLLGINLNFFIPVLVGMASVIAVLFFVFHEVSWFWRFSAIGLATSTLLVINLTIQTRRDVLKRAPV